MVRLAPAPAAIIDDVPVGRLYRDGAIITRSEDGQVRERRTCAGEGFVHADAETELVRTSVDRRAGELFG